MTEAGRTNPEPPQRSGWWLALFAIPVLCCAGPALLAAAGIGSLGALFAAGNGHIMVGMAVGLRAAHPLQLLAATAGTADGQGR